MKKKISVCWLRRDLRIEDNAALYHALKGGSPVLLFFIFDKNILDKLSGPQDPRITFLHHILQKLRKQLADHGSSILITYNTPEKAWAELLSTYQVNAVFTNHDYEPYARERDDTLAEYLATEGIAFKTFKDQVIFEKDEIIKGNGRPYTVFTPYFRQWQRKLNGFYVSQYQTGKYLKNLYRTDSLSCPALKDMGFEHSGLQFPSKDFEAKLADYESKRDLPAADATTHIGLHLRFGTVSIRYAARIAVEQNAAKWLSELAWRDFYMMILWHFSYISKNSFKPAYDQIRWRNDEEDFKAWCAGQTGYPLVDAGMRQLNQTGYMHNRVRMVAASFLTKHLLIDWRWGEAYFAEKLLDYELASNVGGWQWACGSGNDAAPYFRIFNPELQAKKFDPENKYIYRWAPEYKTKKHTQPIVEHAFARERTLKVFKAAIDEQP